MALVRSATLASSVLALAAAGGTTPEQVHLAVAGQDPTTGDATGFTIAWYTEDATDTSVVQYKVQNETKTATGKAVQYLKDHGYHHAVRVVGLPSDTQITYRVGNAAGGWSPFFNATVAPARDTERTIKMSIFGDMGWEDSEQRKMVITVDGLVKDWSATYSRNVLESLKDNGDIEMVWHVGDIGYMDDAFAHDPALFLYESSYNGYLNWLQNLTSIMPYMVSVGNHESECHSGYCIGDYFLGKALSNFTAYNNRWHMPSVESGGHENSNMWYSWNYGPVHFVSLDTETDYHGAGEEHVGDSGIKWLTAGGFGYDGEYLAWVENDLKQASEARANGTGRPWLIAGGHRPYGEIKDHLGEMFAKYGVDMYFAGHGHSYSRSYPSNGTHIEDHHHKNFVQAAESPVWIMVGGAGCEEMVQGNESLEDGYAAPVGAQVSTYARYATGVLEANQTALHWRVIDSVNGTVVDEITVTK